MNKMTKTENINIIMHCYCNYYKILINHYHYNIIIQNIN